MKKILLIISTIAVLLGFVRGGLAADRDRVSFDIATQPSKSVAPKAKPVELSFEPPAPELPVRLPKLAVSLPLQPSPSLFVGGSDSLVARTVGHAEGTRTIDGGKTRAYYGHVDPGNGVWNLGSFSYQHCYTQCTPEEADDRQLQRLRNQSEILSQRAANYGMRLSIEEKLNGIDLSNQAPLAALDRGGYIDRLNAAYQSGLTGSNAVLWARTYSFINPKTQTWDAPGLGNTYDRISQDQERRRSAIARVLDEHRKQQSQANIASSKIRLTLQP